MPLSLTYDDPFEAVLLRILAWEESVRPDAPPIVKEVVANQVQTARKELGLAEICKGAPHAALARLRHKSLLRKENPPRPMEVEWRSKKAWRQLYIPPHNAVRQLSDRPIFSLQESGNQSHKHFKVVLRNPVVPNLRVYVGNDLPRGGTLEGQRGVYFLRLSGGFYLGKTDELHIRMREHYSKKKPQWWVFVSPQSDGQALSLDTLWAAETLLISYWNEISTVTNDQRGRKGVRTISFPQ